MFFVYIFLGLSIVVNTYFLKQKHPWSESRGESNVKDDLQELERLFR
jgi:hypothetical protein